MSRSQAPQKTLEIRLYGHLRRSFGKSYHLAVRNAGEAVRALCVVLPGFQKHLLEHSAPGYRVWLSDEPIQSVDQLKHPPGKLIRIVPVMAGAKSGGLGQIVLGAALIAISVYTGGAGLSVFAAYAEGGIGLAASSIAFSVGFSMVLGGVSQLLAGSPSGPATPAEKPQNQPSYLFNGAINTVSQGNPVPVLYGRLTVGSQVISTGLSVSAL